MVLRPTVQPEAALLGGEWYRVPKEELNALVEKAMQKDPMRVGALACRAQSAVDEYTSLEEKLKSTSNPTKKKQLSKLLGRKKIELDGALNEIAAIASKPPEAIYSLGIAKRERKAFRKVVLPLVNTQHFVWLA